MSTDDPKKKAQLPAWIGKEIKDCMQCGTCSGVCPAAKQSDTQGPRKLMAIELAGEHEKAMHAEFLWLCTSCQACTDNCPKNLHVSSIVGGIKQCAIDSDIAPSGDAQVKMISKFAEVIEGGGRISEFKLMRKVIGFNPSRALKNAPVAMKLIAHHRLKLSGTKIENSHEISTMFEKMEEQDAK